MRPNDMPRPFAPDHSDGDDLVQRLRSRMDADELELEAADEIERLTREDECKAREIERLRAEVANWKADFARACEDRAAQANECKTAIARAANAERELAELRERIEHSPCFNVPPQPPFGGAGVMKIPREALPRQCKRVRLVRED